MHLWRNARNLSPVQYQAHNHGWRITDNNKLDIVWFESHQHPDNFSDILAKESAFIHEDEDDHEEVTYSAWSDEEDADSVK